MGGLVTALLVLVLTGAALWIRLDGLQGWDGTLTVDEARLALAARGVVQTGLPRMPSGWMYTRGLLATYLTAPSLALLGETDFAARLPAVLAGTALIPVAFALGREVAGRVGGLFVAALLVGHPSFVVWSRQAWFYALYVLLLRGGAAVHPAGAPDRPHPRDQLLAGALVRPHARSPRRSASSCWRRSRVQIRLAAVVGSASARGAGWRPLASLAIVGLAALVLWAAGDAAARRQPGRGVRRDRGVSRVRRSSGRGSASTCGCCSTVRACCCWRQSAGLRWRSVSGAPTRSLLWLALLPAFVHASFLIPRGPQERYGLTLVLVIAVLAPRALVLAEPIARRAWHVDGLAGRWPRCHRRHPVGGDLAGAPGRWPAPSTGRRSRPARAPGCGRPARSGSALTTSS